MTLPVAPAPALYSDGHPYYTAEQLAAYAQAAVKAHVQAQLRAAALAGDLPLPPPKNAASEAAYQEFVGKEVNKLNKDLPPWLESGLDDGDIPF